MTHYVDKCFIDNDLLKNSRSLTKGRYSMEKAKYSLDSDGTFISRKGTGDFSVTQYDCRNQRNLFLKPALKIYICMYISCQFTLCIVYDVLS